LHIRKYPSVDFHFEWVNWRLLPFFIPEISQRNLVPSHSLGPFTHFQSTSFGETSLSMRILNMTARLLNPKTATSRVDPRKVKHLERSSISGEQEADRRRRYLTVD
jgi:hypothetical protein